VTNSQRSSEPPGQGEFDRLYLSTRVPMIRLARLFTDSDSLAEEIVQEAFLRIHQHGPGIENPEAYLRTTVTNLSKSLLRRRRLERTATRCRDAFVSDPEIDESWDAICCLPFRQRSVLILRFYEDLSVEEIARALDCRPGTVKSRLHRGLEQLRKELS
jgi:RNA polymerase sigma-70 factor (sigma-E family)